MRIKTVLRAGSDWKNLYWGPAINRFFTRIPDLNNFPAHTGFLVMTI